MQWRWNNGRKDYSQFAHLDFRFCPMGWAFDEVRDEFFPYYYAPVDPPDQAKDGSEEEKKEAAEDDEAEVKVDDMDVDDHDDDGYTTDAERGG